MGRYELISDEAKQIIRRANDVAMEFGSNFVNGEHVILALLSESMGIAAKALQSLGVQLSSLRKEIQGQAATVDKRTPRMELKQILDGAIQESVVLGQNAVRVEHLLLGILHLRQSVAVEALYRVGADADKLATAIIGHMGQPPQP